MTTTQQQEPTTYRGFEIRPTPGGSVAVYGPNGSFRGKFVSEPAARQWITAHLAAAPRIPIK